MSSLGDTVIDSDSEKFVSFRRKKAFLLMSVDVHSGGVFLGVDCVLDFFKGYKTKASGFLSLLIVDKLAALEQ